MPRNTDSSNFMLVMNVTNTITHLMLGAVSISAIIFASRYSSISLNLSQHIYLCVTGYVIMMTQAVLTFSRHNGWSVSLSYQDKKVFHWVMQVVGAILAIAGSSIRINNINNNFQNAHGIFGLIALILTSLSLFGGLINLYTERNTITNLIHSCVGSLTLISAFICLCLGFDKTIFRLAMGQTGANLLIALAVFALAGTLLTASISNSKRLLRR